MTTHQRFMHRLALEIGGMTVRELSARLSVREYYDWIFFLSEKNQPQEADAANVDVAALAAAFGGGKRKAKKNGSPEPESTPGHPPE